MWVKWSSERWHAANKGGTGTLCGKHLPTQGKRSVDPNPGKHAVRCTRCMRLALGAR